MPNQNEPVPYAQYLLNLIGKAPEGSHPDEWGPRAGTWHEERQNWIREVDGLRAEVKRLTDVLAKVERDTLESFAE